MPGLCGYVESNYGGVSDQLLSDMARALKDEEWYKVDLYQGEQFGLGRISLGLLNPESQPLWNEDRTVCVVMEGELYDYAEMKKCLVDRGHKFETENDVEYLLHLFEEYEEGLTPYLNGSFVAAIWKEPERKLVIVNDHLGSYPLYYSVQGGMLTFASGVRALLVNSKLSVSMDPTAIAQFLTFEHILGTRTLVKQIQLLKPASILTYQDGIINFSSYWRLCFDQIDHRYSEEDYVDGFALHLRRAIKRQLRDDSPVGILLSGGLDSRLILAMLKEIDAERPIYTFSFGIPGCDDVRISKEVARIARTTHQFYELNPDYLSHLAHKAVRLTDGMQSCVNMHSFANIHAQTEFVKLIYKGYLAGTLTGYSFNRQMWADYEEDTLIQLLYDKLSVVFPTTQHRDLFSEDYYRHNQNTNLETFKEAFMEYKTDLVANWIDHFTLRNEDIRLGLSGVELVRSQAVVRTPFSDLDLVKYAFSVPAGLRADRYLMVRIYQKFFSDYAKIPYANTGLPIVACFRDLRIRFINQIRWRLNEAGIPWISTPHKRPYADYNTWLRTVLGDWMKSVLLDKKTLERGYFQPGFIHNLVAEHMAGTNHARKLGALISLELWHRQFID